MSLPTTVKNNALDALNGVATFTPVVAPVRMRLMTANGTATAAGTELATGAGGETGTGYTAGGQTFTWAAAANGTAILAADIRWDNMPAGTIVGLEVWDSATTPRRIQYTPLTTQRTLAAGQAFELKAADVVATLT